MGAISETRDQRLGVKLPCTLWFENVQVLQTSVSHLDLFEEAS